MLCAPPPSDSGNRCLFEMCVSHLQIVFLRHRFRIANPPADNVGGIGFHQFRFSRRPQVLERLLPGHDARPLHNAIEFRPQVLA
jgi:hypothetical protein